MHFLAMLAVLQCVIGLHRQSLGSNGRRIGQTALQCLNVAVALFSLVAAFPRARRLWDPSTQARRLWDPPTQAPSPSCKRYQFI